MIFVDSNIAMYLVGAAHPNKARAQYLLEAAIAVRIQRRAEQLRAGGRSPETDEVLAEVVERDRRDRERTESPLTRDESYQLLDTSQLAPEEVVERILTLIRARLQES